MTAEAPSPVEVAEALAFFRAAPEGLDVWESGEATTPAKQYAAVLVRAALAVPAADEPREDTGRDLTARDVAAAWALRPPGQTMDGDAVADYLNRIARPAARSAVPDDEPREDVPTSKYGPEVPCPECGHETGLWWQSRDRDEIACDQCGWSGRYGELTVGQNCPAARSAVPDTGAVLRERGAIDHALDRLFELSRGGQDDQLIRQARDELTHLVPARSVDAARPAAETTTEPDVEDDGVLYWLDGDVAMDNTAPGRIPARITVTGYGDLSMQGATRLRDALSAAIAAATTTVSPWAPVDADARGARRGRGHAGTAARRTRPRFRSPRGEGPCPRGVEAPPAKEGLMNCGDEACEAPYILGARRHQHRYRTLAGLTLGDTVTRNGRPVGQVQHLERLAGGQVAVLAGPLGARPVRFLARDLDKLDKESA